MWKGQLLKYLIKSLEMPKVPKLKFQHDGTFKILQLADIDMTSHRSECNDIPSTSEWSNCTNLKTLEFAERIIKTEKPDMIAFTRDNRVMSK
ncbi:Phosphatase dcr2 [Basidiobolus ranarum]|uniref:Phosphatase dcr2 n=1 Tax=Basidiobolus ranarum TaxID=34480 RepID=A0ABR2WKN3_9FUNG